MSKEQELLAKLQVPPPSLSQKDLFRHLLAFWQHTTLYKRKCDRTGKEIISVFSEQCPYPVWYKDDWIAHANPPTANFDFKRPFFEQLWELFQKCPLPHNTVVNCENCEYTDDWWYSKRCFLGHSGLNCEDVYYSYRIINCRNCFFCVFSNNCELGTDLVNCVNCYNVMYALDSAQCRDSAFLFDCRNCSDCILCFNLRNKQYCIENVQYTKEEYEQKKAEYHFSSRIAYDKQKARFKELLETKAWWRAQHLDQTENVVGDYLREVKNSEQAFFVDRGEDVIKCLRALNVKDIIYSVGCFGSELVAYTVFLGSEGLYDIKYCVNLTDSKFMEYCLFCANCEHCFGCAGLVGKKYCIFNQQYSSEEYERHLQEIKSHLRHTQEYGQLFPAYFAPGAYDETLAEFYFPLTQAEQERLGFRTRKDSPSAQGDTLASGTVPDDAKQMDKSTLGKAFWDEVAQKPFSIQPFDIQHSEKQGVSLPNCFYARRLNENFAWLYFTGEMRETVCAHTGEKVQTTLPETLDGRILSLAAYEKTIY